MYATEDEKWMRLALCEAEKALALGEVPVGAVIVRGGKIVGTGFNRRECGQNALLHAEIEAIGCACGRLQSWRLNECALFVTLEPCPMCAGAIINARIPRVVYGAPDPKAGACGSVADLFAMPFSHGPAVSSGVLACECTALMNGFFRRIREKE
ncbi:MAG: nucleoside deaminase [Clostridia bacterium]|nr:nucleoside deaminase [Clostridia bacterium]MDR3644514.1 nucleoside deaminase [Clostridia bacterium]